MTKAQDNVKNYVDKITKNDPILKEIRRLKMSNIEEMEKQVDNLSRVIISRLFGREHSNTINMIRDFMQMSLDQHKDTIDRMARLEKAIAELLKKEER